MSQGTGYNISRCSGDKSLGTITSTIAEMEDLPPHTTTLTEPESTGKPQIKLLAMSHQCREGGAEGLN